MRFKTISSVIEHFDWLCKKYNEFNHIQHQNIYRIIEIKKLPYNQNKLIIQVIGKSSIIECYPQEIAANDQFLEGFSKKDIRTITYLACEQVKKPKYKIIMQEFYGEFNKIKFKLQETQSETVIVKTADEIVMDKDLLNNLSKDDVKSISYIAGYECSHERSS